MTKQRHIYQPIISLFILYALQTLSFVEALVIPPPVVHFGLGAIAGTCGAVAAYPFDYIKSQMQTEQGQMKYQNNGFKAFCEIMKENPMQLFRGVGVQVTGIAPEKAIKLGTNEMCKNFFISQFGYVPLLGEVLAGTVAGTCQVVVTNPLEVIKVGLQTSDMSISQLMKKIGGLKGLFNGAEACLVRDIVFSAALFPIYSHANEVLPAFVAGALAGVVGSFIATPADFVKTRILSQNNLVHRAKKKYQTNSNSINGKFPFRKALAGVGATSSAASIVVSNSNQDEDVNDDYLSNKNPFSVAYKISKREGPSVLLSGATERCIGSIPRFGVTLAMYDFLEACAKHHGWF